MSSAVKEIVKKAAALNGHERAELFEALPRILKLPPRKRLSDKAIARMAHRDQESLKTGKGLKRFKSWAKFLAHLKSL